MVGTTPPAKHISYDGLQLKLSVNDASVANAGSPISYRGVSVGQVDNIALSESGEHVEINITIDEAYRHFVTPFSRFYNASGVTVSGGLGDLTVKTESVDAMLTGGISFYNPEDVEHGTQPQEGDVFTLFSSYEQARSAGTLISIVFNDIAGLQSRMKVKYKDQDIGYVERLIFDELSFKTTAMAYLNDTGKKFAVTGSKFWLEQPEIGLIGTKHVGDILSGGFIGVLPGRGDNETQFNAEDIAPVVEQLPYGLNIQLIADRLGSVRVGNPVLYRQVQVGTVIGVDLSDTADKVNIFINIAQRYANLVTAQSEFWNTSGLSLEAGLFSGLEIESESIEAIIAGGIAFATPELDGEQAHIPAEQGAKFMLAPDFDDKWHQWAPKIDISAK